MILLSSIPSEPENPKIRPFIELSVMNSPEIKVLLKPTHLKHMYSENFPFQVLCILESVNS